MLVILDCKTSTDYDIAQLPLSSEILRLNFLAELAGGQSENDDTSPDNIFEKLRLMGSATATNEGGPVSLHRSLQSISDTMLAMKRGLDSITGKSDEISNKRAKISQMQANKADDGSSSTSDAEDIVDTYLHACQPGGCRCIFCKGPPRDHSC